METDLASALIIVAALIGGALIYFAVAAPAKVRGKSADEKAALATSEAAQERSKYLELSVAKAAADTVAAGVPELKETVVRLQSSLSRSEAEAARLSAGLEAERKEHAARVEDLERMGKEIEDKFVLLAQEALGKNTENFLKLVSERYKAHEEGSQSELEKRQTAIQALVEPITASLTKFEVKVGQLELAREGAYKEIQAQVAAMATGQTQLRTETSRLVQALRQPKTRGRWGEYQLRNVMEMSGMTKHVDFFEQPTVEGSEGKLRPDAKIVLPGGKVVIVDAKTPLEAYLSAIEEQDEDKKAEWLTNHARQVRNHISALSSQEYWKALPLTPDFVVMFVPGEAIYSAAFEADPTLFDQAVANRVLICTPTTLIALVKAIGYGWQQQAIAENAQAVAKLGRELYDRVKIFSTHVGRVGHAIKQSVERYNQAIGSLEGRVLPAARKFESLEIVGAADSIETLEPIEVVTRDVQAVELLSTPAGLLEADDA